MGIKAENLIGKRFGKWLVIERDSNKYERPKWIYRDWEMSHDAGLGVHPDISSFSNLDAPKT